MQLITLAQRSAHYHVVSEVGIWETVRWWNTKYKDFGQACFINFVKTIDEEEVMEIAQEHGWTILTQEMYDETF